MASAVPSAAPDPVDLQIDLIVALAEARLLLHCRTAHANRCAHCEFAVDPRESLVVNRAIGLVYHPRCAP